MEKAAAVVQRSAQAAKQSAEAIARAAKEAAWRKKQARNNRLYFPNEIIHHVPWVGKHEANTEEGKVVKFRVSPKMTKVEMKNWIEVAYDTPVKKVSVFPAAATLRGGKQSGMEWMRGQCAS